jgi:hypothetical protein
MDSHAQNLRRKIKESRLMAKRIILSRFCRLAVSCLTLGLFLGRPVCGQIEGPTPQPRNWDLGVLVAGATGEENTNSFAEAQVLTAAVSVGKVLTGEIGKGWRRGRFEYGMDFIPLFRQFRPHEVHGIGFEPVILRWNSSLHTWECPSAPAPFSLYRIGRRSFTYQR